MSIIAYPTSAHADVCALALELYEKAGGANWNGMGYVRELRLLATGIAAICGARLCELEFENARMDSQRRSGVDLEVDERAKNLDWNNERQVAALYGDVIFLHAIVHARRWKLWEENDEGG